MCTSIECTKPYHTANKEREYSMFNTETTSCSCGCCGKCKCGFNPCAVTCGGCVNNFGEYAYIYNTTAQTVDNLDAFTFSANGPLSGGITHIAGTENVVINKTGVYLVTFYVYTGGNDVDIELYKNSQPVEGGIYHVPYGQVIVSAQMGDVITLVNTSGIPIMLRDDEGEVNASMTLVRLF